LLAGYKGEREALSTLESELKTHKTNLIDISNDLLSGSLTFAEL
jgi:hypothetical protein